MTAQAPLSDRDRLVGWYALGTATALLVVGAGLLVSGFFFAGVALGGIGSAIGVIFSFYRLIADRKARLAQAGLSD